MTRLIIDKPGWIKELEAIRRYRLLSYKDLAQEIGIRYYTLLNFLDTTSKVQAFPKTLRKIQKYINNHIKKIKVKDE